MSISCSELWLFPSYNPRGPPFRAGLQGSRGPWARSLISVYLISATRNRKWQRTWRSSFDGFGRSSSTKTKSSHAPMLLEEHAPSPCPPRHQSARNAFVPCVGTLLEDPRTPFASSGTCSVPNRATVRRRPQSSEERPEPSEGASRCRRGYKQKSRTRAWADGPPS